jgi:hypothetical protein
MCYNQLSEIYLSLLIEHFNLTDETEDNLKMCFESKFLSSKRVIVTKPSMYSLQRNISKSFHENVVNTLKKYADDTALEKYMKAEGWMYEHKNDMHTILAYTFIIFECDSIDKLIKYVRDRYTNFNFWEFEKIKDGYFIAYN